jgi:hypothetical protein
MASDLRRRVNRALIAETHGGQYMELTKRPLLIALISLLVLGGCSSLPIAIRSPQTMKSYKDEYQRQMDANVPIVIFTVDSRVNPSGTRMRNGNLDVVVLRDATLDGNNPLCLTVGYDFGKRASSDIVSALNTNAETRFTWVVWYMELSYDLNNLPPVKSFPPEGNCMTTTGIAFDMPNGMRYVQSDPQVARYLK